MSSQFSNLLSKPRLENKVAIITGAASGIGEAAARLFAAHGATVVIADVQDALGESVAKSVNNCTYTHCDVTDENQIQKTVAKTVATHGRLDIMFSNAGILGSPTSILKLNMDDLDKLLAVNVRGTAAAIKHAANAMVTLGIRGSIVCTASVAAKMGGFATADYTASKHAVMGLVRAAAGELGQHGIRVNAVSPFGVATPLACSSGFTVEEVEKYTGMMNNLKGVVLKAEHVAEAALFLASDESAVISGHELMVDGGTTAVATMKLG